MAINSKTLTGIVLVGVLAVLGALVFYFAFSVEPNDEKIDYQFRVNLTVPGLGSLEGRHSDGAVAFYGVPYAAQPERFQHAGFPPEPWGHRDAYLKEKHSLECVHRCYGPKDDWVPGCNTFEEGGQSEQCLYMSITVPERFAFAEDISALEKVPVMLYLHGGGFTGGSGQVPLYDGRPIAAMGDIIYIAVNYRLGVFGFGPFEADYENEKAFGNFGLTDQQRALEFVHNYIEYFGGDKNSVTLGGQSAGSESAYVNLVASGRHQAWFDKTLMMSVPLSLPYLTTAQAKRSMVEAILDQVALDTDGACNVTYNALRPYDDSCLYDTEVVPTIVMYDASRKAVDNFFDLTRFMELFSLAQIYQPIVDGLILTDQMVEMSKTRMTTDKAVMVGSTGDEGELFVKSALPGSLYSNLTEELYRDIFGVLWKISPNNDLYEEGMTIYPWDLDCTRLRENYPKDCNAVDAANSAVRDFIFLCPQKKILENGNKNKGAGKNFFLWYFDEPFPWVPPQLGGGYKRCDVLACHGVDINYVHGDDIVLPQIYVNYEEQLISRKMQAYISNFVRHGDANNNSGREDNIYTKLFADLDLPEWKPFNNDNWGYMRFNSTIDGVVKYQDQEQGNLKVIRDNVYLDGQYIESGVVVDHEVGCDYWDRMDRYGKV